MVRWWGRRRVRVRRWERFFVRDGRIAVVGEVTARERLEGGREHWSSCNFGRMMVHWATTGVLRRHV